MAAADRHIPIDSLHSDKSGSVVEVKSTSDSVVVCSMKVVLTRAEFEERFTPLGGPGSAHGEI